MKKGKRLANAQVGKWLGIMGHKLATIAEETMGEGFMELLNDLAENVRDQTIDECVKRLGGRYGAAATRDLFMLKGKK
jgi:hypothetical protein